jgi:cutinase
MSDSVTYISQHSNLTIRIKGISGSQFVPVLKATIPDVAVEGLNFRAGLATAKKTIGTTDRAAINEATRLFTLAATKCPDTVILASGWSLGAAVLILAIQDLPKNIQDRIGGALFYGDLLYETNKTSIPNFPTTKTMRVCSPKDAVCRPGNELTISAGHMSYPLSPANYAEGVAWLSSKAAKSNVTAATPPAAFTPAPTASPPRPPPKPASPGHSHGG